VLRPPVTRGWCAPGRFKRCAPALLVWAAAVPATESVVVHGIAQPAEVIRDVDGVPHIFAANAEDAYFALGYVHAQDRLWQMEINRRAGSGTLSEILGVDALDDDRLIRTVGVRRAAEQDLQDLDAKTQRILRSYAAGVNARLDSAPVLPFEFQWFGFRATRWVPADSLTWLKMMAWNLSGNWWEELLNLKLSRRLTSQQIAELLPPYPGDEAHVLPDLNALYGAAPASAVSPPASARGLPRARRLLGSNNWVVSGSRTTTGKPLLANDPHTRLSAPALWYLAHLHAPGLNVIGATLPGVPGVFLGRNERVAWSFTNTGPDTQDLYVERLVPGDSLRYATPLGAKPFELIPETIRIKGRQDEHLNVRISRHGPVLSDAVPEAADLAPPGTALALRWVGSMPGDLTLQFMVHAATARNGAEVLNAARYLHTPQQNLVYADMDGAIGFVAAGRVPVRKRNNPLLGLAPAPGWDERYDWDGLIPFEELPHDLNPVSGKIVTANQKVTPPGYPHWITSGWFPPYRADRINEMLDQTPRHDVDSFAAIQADVKNPVAEQLLPWLLQWEPDREDERIVVGQLRSWDRRMTTGSSEALIFAEWIRQLDAVLLKDRLGELYDWIDDYNPVFLMNALRNREDPSGWCGQAAAGGAHPCRNAVARALRTALNEIAERQGSDRARWSWGRAHFSRATHLPVGALGLLAPWLDFRMPSPGGRDTVNVSGYSFDTDSGLYIGDTGASFRAIYDLGDPEKSVFVLNAGQSGSPFSSHYGDMVDKWLKGGYVPMTTERTGIIKRAHDRLTLSPG